MTKSFTGPAPSLSPITEESNTIDLLPTLLPIEDSAQARRARLSEVTHWFYYLGFEPQTDLLERLVAATYDLVVLEPILTDKENVDFPMANWVSQLHTAPHSKIVIAYIDIGQAEDWRTYWQDGWEVGDPDWIVALDPDGWEGNYPVAFWRQEWREIWLGVGGYLEFIINLGFDGIYLDWVEAYSDDNVIAAAKSENVDPEAEIVRWISDLAAYGRAQNNEFLVIAQNAPELVELDEYLQAIDGIAQEQTWFDGGADNDPPGDCPLPRREEDIESKEYEESLSEDCLRLYEDFPESTLYVSSEWYLYYLNLALEKGVIVFTVDYATHPENISWVYETARRMGFIPFVSQRALDIYIEPVP